MTNLKLILHSVLYTLFAVSLILNILVYNGFVVMPPAKSADYEARENIKEIFNANHKVK